MPLRQEGPRPARRKNRGERQVNPAVAHFLPALPREQCDAYRVGAVRQDDVPRGRHSRHFDCPQPAQAFRQGKLSLHSSTIGSNSVSQLFSKSKEWSASTRARSSRAKLPVPSQTSQSTHCCCQVRILAPRSPRRLPKESESTSPMSESRCQQHIRAKHQKQKSFPCPNTFYKQISFWPSNH